MRAGMATVAMTRDLQTMQQGQGNPHRYKWSSVPRQFLHALTRLRRSPMSCW